MIYFCVLVVGLAVACQNATSDDTTTTTAETLDTPERTAEQEAAAKTARLLEQYPNKDGYIQLTWDTLANMDFDVRFVEEMDGDVPFPIFSESVNMLDGELIEIEGYVIPFEETGDEEVTFLSAFPYTQCFFCGAAGPESVMDILASEPLGRLKMDSKMHFRGRLRLNDSDLDYLNYILDDAELVER